MGKIEARRNALYDFLCHIIIENEAVTNYPPKVHKGEGVRVNDEIRKILLLPFFRVFFSSKIQIKINF